jgi:signal transduction histidine kinase
VKAWLSRNAETLVLAGSLAVIASLVAWWAIFISKTLIEVDPSRAERLTFMIRGESSVFAFALVACMVALFAIARRARADRRRMERLLQFTSHELKTPIAGVRALLQSLSLGSIPEDAKKEFLAQGVGECDRLEHLAETILAYQRTVARNVMRREKLRADSLLDDVVSHRKRTTTGEHLEIDPLGESAPQVWADRDAFRVILENLLDNARKYGAGKTHITAKADGTRWTVHVRDEGQGFEPAEAELIFDPFAARPKNGVTHGSGLGLSISRQLARAMGGDLRAESPGPGKGSTFTLELQSG